MDAERLPMRSWKTACGLVCFLILLSNIWIIAHWSESRGVYDDICYLRQAHLFQRFGLDGLNTDIARDDDHYLASKLKEIGFAQWADPAEAPCHSLMPRTHRRVMQYPPGTGLLLAAFPSGFQVKPLYVLANVFVLGFVLLAISYARTRDAVLLTAAFGCLAMYLMINPTKASYSMAPTMVLCALAGLFTARLFSEQRATKQILFAALVGFLIGLSVNFRLPNLFLTVGYFVVFVGMLLRERKAQAVWLGMSFGLACLIGMVPTLAANAINAGSPLATTYAGVDLAPPILSYGLLLKYLRDMQFVLLLLACGWTGWVLQRTRDPALRWTAWMSTGNLIFNLAFFLSHPIFEPYYTVPLEMLSLWSLLYASLPQPAVVVAEDSVPVRVAKA
ncbi:MAG TPA: hypothetical protein VMU69_10665 [Bradyrhizobium sp.]|nr:hypothetical protein [Bradyrhizobium sp.]